ncbi:hypothetical protein BD310DRAFT_812041, partial [Dichomitus squalens]
DPSRFVFGYGRRICPGQYFAETSLFLTIAMVLHVFDIAPPLDDTGKFIVIEPKMTNTILSLVVSSAASRSRPTTELRQYVGILSMCAADHPAFE